MIADNMVYIAIFVFIMLLVGLILTVMEFRYGDPKRQQERANRNPGPVSELRDAAEGRPAR